MLYFAIHQLGMPIVHLKGHLGSQHKKTVGNQPKTGLAVFNLSGEQQIQQTYAPNLSEID